MPTILPDRALLAIEPVVDELLGAWGQFPPALQQQIESLYLTMLQQARAALYPVQRGLAVARFLAAVDELPAVHAVAGQLIAPAYGVVRRSSQPIPDSPLLERLPASLAHAREQHQSAMPPDDAQLAESLPEAEMTTAPYGLATAPGVETAGDTNGHSSTREIGAPGSSPSAPPAPQGAGGALTRYPSLEYPREVALGARTSLMVLLEVEQRQPQSVAVMVADSAPTPPVLEVVLRARGFDVEGSNTQLLEVSRGGDSELRFVLIPRQAGEQELRVDFYQDGRRIGTARHTVQVVAQAAPALVRAAHVPLEPLEIGQGRSVAPDLELCVQADRSDARVLYFSLHSTVENVDLHHADAGTVRLQGSPLDKMQQVYKTLSRYAGQTPSDHSARLSQRAELERIGRNLWDELVSEQLKAGYWQWKDRISTLLITSDEPWIPWEIVKPYRWDEANRLVDEPFLCEKFHISRWLSGPGPADRVPMQWLRPVAPKVSNLASVQQELEFLRAINLLNGAVSADEPFSERGPVIDLFTNGRFNVLHIAAHGGFNALQPDDSSIMLDGGELRPADIFGRFGGPRPRPLVFINACHGARLEHAFTGLGGWADRLVRGAKVGAFIGTAWEVNDRLALQFAQAFYQALLRDGKPLGESFWLARRHIRDLDPSNSTWLAYVLYADPGAHAALASNGARI